MTKVNSGSGRRLGLINRYHVGASEAIERGLLSGISQEQMLEAGHQSLALLYALTLT
jgi:hypothetical protein